MRWLTRWPLQPLQTLQKTAPPFGPSVDSLCHPWFTTTNLSYRFPICETSATALRGTTGIWYICALYVCCGPPPCYVFACFHLLPPYEIFPLPLWLVVPPPTHWGGGETEDGTIYCIYIYIFIDLLWFASWLAFWRVFWRRLCLPTAPGLNLFAYLHAAWSWQEDLGGLSRPQAKICPPSFNLFPHIDVWGFWF